MEINDISGGVVDGSIKVHTYLGPGLLESAYQACLAYEHSSSPTSSSVGSGPGC